LRNVHLHRTISPRLFPSKITKTNLTSSQTLRYRQPLSVQIGGHIQERTHVLPTKIIRILTFAPDLDNPGSYEELSRNEEEPLVVPEVNSMRSDLIQLIAMLEGQPDDDDFTPALAPDLADDLGLQQWLEEDEWEDTEFDASQGGGEGGLNLEDLD
jgi:hypothetical protein